MSGLSDSEALDLIEYLLFPNMVPWGGQALPIVYRFRPNGNDPDSHIMEIMFLFAIGRMPGWIANWKEIHDDPKGRIYRPRQVYVGHTGEHWMPREERHYDEED